MLNFSQIEEITDDKAPLYSQYPQQINPQPAYICLYEDGRVCADYSGEIGNARPADEWHGRTLTWRITPFLTGRAVGNLLMSEPVKGLLERVHAGHDSEWNGNNFVGTLTDDAQAAFERLERIFEEEEEDIEVWNVEDWLFNSCRLADHWPAGDMDLDMAVSGVEETLTDTDKVIELNGDIEESLLERAQYYLTSLEKGLGQNHFSALIAAEMATQEEVDEYLDYFVPSPDGIRTARKALNMTQEQAGAVIGATRRAWQDWEAGRRNMPGAKWELFQIKGKQAKK